MPPKRGVEAELGLKLGDILWGAATAEDQRRRIAGQDAQKKEGDEGDPEQHRDELDQRQGMKRKISMLRSRHLVGGSPGP